MQRLKYIAGVPQNGSWGDEPGAADVDLRCVRVTDFDRRRLRLGTDGVTRGYSRADAQRLGLRSTDLILEKSGGGDRRPVGFVVRCDDRVQGQMCSNFVARIRPPRGVDSDWLVHVFAALYALGRTQPFVKQVTGIQNLDTAAFLNLPVPALSLEDQRGIARAAQAGLDRTVSIENTIDGLRGRLAEYRDALITEAVTGKLDIARLSDQQLDESAHAALEGERPEVLTA